MDTVIILGDFNACVGKDWKSWPNVIGKHGAGKMNSGSLMLLEFCTRFQLSIMGHNVPTKRQLEEHMARSIEQQAPRVCLFFTKSRKRVKRSSRKLDIRSDDGKKILVEQFLHVKLCASNTDFDKLSVVLQNAATQVFGKRNANRLVWWSRWRNSKAAPRQESGQACFGKAYQRAQEHMVLT